MARESTRNLLLIYVAAWLRSFSIGFLGVVLGVYLSREGFSATAIGLVIAAGLAGAAVGTVFITFNGDRLGRRRPLVAVLPVWAPSGVALLFSARVRSGPPPRFLGR